MGAYVNNYRTYYHYYVFIQITKRSFTGRSSYNISQYFNAMFRILYIRLSYLL